MAIEVDIHRFATM